MSAPSGGPHDIEGDRGISDAAPVRRRRLKTWQKTAFVLIVMGAVVTFEFSGATHRPRDDSANTSPQAIGQAVQLDDREPPDVHRAALIRPPDQAPPKSIDQVIKDKIDEAVHAQAAPSRMMSYASSFVARGGASGAGSASGGTGPAAPSAPTATHTRVIFKAGTIEGGKAGPAMDLTLVMMPQVIPCVLRNAIDTTQPGPIFCSTFSDVKSAAGITLMEAGTQITGSYSSSVSQGQNRMPMVSASGITPYGVPIVFPGAMGDELGRAGVTGQVDTHFWDRFSGALLLMTSQGAIGAVQAALQRGNGNNYLNLQTGGVDSAVADALHNSINIAPTIRVDQGTRIGLLLTVPIDFSDSYVLHTR